MDGLGESKCDSTFDLECQCGQADCLVGKVVPCVREVCDFDEQKGMYKHIYPSIYGSGRTLCAYGVDKSA